VDYPQTAPVVVDDNATGVTATPTTINVLGNDSDAEGDINSSTVALVGADANNEIIVANEGTWSVNNTTGDITFTPVAGFTADPTAVTYTVTDNTGVVSNAASVTVDYPQTPTVSTEDNVTAVSGNEVVIDVLANDSDPQNDTDPTTVKIIDPTGNPVTTLTVPNEGTWDVNATTGAISFTPVTGFTGDPTPITYVVSDTTGNTSSPVTVNIVISLDSDGDGIADDVDLDDDNDGILDTVEEHGIRNLDTDGDGVPDRLDLDSDNDGMLDLLESGQDVATVDTNNDGVLDSTTDADQDGVMDSADADDSDATSAGTVTPIDTDGDSKPDFQDVDSDNDSIADAIEAGVPSDKVDATTGMIATPVVDANGIPTITPSVTTPVDTDGDTVPNYRDLDSDNDGLNDIEEADGLDENKDGIVDVEDLVDAVTLPDMDGNNIPDVLEPNNPNLPVVVDTNGDGVIDDATDTDNDGIPDVTDGQVDNFGTGTAIDSDGDGIADIYDIDDDNDGIPDVVEAKGNPTRDTDGDGIIDSLDLDADNDGILDIVEAGGVDANNDGRVDNATDGDKDGLADVADAASTTANHPTNENEGRLATLLLVPDTDKDSKDDFQDVDSDNDGLSDLVEARTDASNDEDNNGMIDGGVDANGIPTATTPIANPLDSDSDGKPDYRELDSDNDGIKDIVEAGGEDTDNNGLVDAADMLVDVSNLPDSNSNGIPNYREIPEVVTPTPVEPETSTPTPVVEEVLVEDRVVSDLAQPVTVNVLENDRANVNSTTVEIGLPEGFMEAHPDAILSDDGKSLTVPNEGTWTVNSDGTITYRAELGTDIVDPTPISYSVETTDGTRLETDTKIILSQSVIGGATETNSTEVCEDYEENVSIYSNGTILLVILLGSLFGVFLFRQER
jgi:CshA-type fibril repeat protein